MPIPTAPGLTGPSEELEGCLDPRAFMRLAHIVRNRIDAGTYEEGEVVSLTRLRDEFGIARQTAAKTLKLLESEGRVYRVIGYGYLVQKAKKPRAR